MTAAPLPTPTASEGQERGENLVGVKGHLFRASACQPAWGCVRCGLTQGEVIQDATFGWCRT